MWLLLVVALSWVAMSVPIAAALGAPASLAAMRPGGGPWAVAMSGASVGTVVGAIVVFGVGLGGALRLRTAPKRRVVTSVTAVALVIAVLGPMGREAVDLKGLEGDPFAVVIQATWQGLQSIVAE